MELKQISYQHLDIPLDRKECISTKSLDHLKSNQIKVFEFISILYKLIDKGNLIEGIEVLSPFGKFPIRGFNLDISVTEREAGLSADGLKKDSSAKAYLLSANSIDSVSRREVMKKIVLYFFDLDGRKVSELNLNREFIGTNYSLNPLNRELVFLRKYGENYYYLKLKFNVGISEVINQNAIGNIVMI